MREDRRAIVVAFCLGLLPTLVIPALFPRLRLAFFAPFLVLLLYRKPLVTCLWWSTGVGCLLDLLSGYPRLGLVTLSYCLTSATLYALTPYFFIEKLSTLPLMTFLFGSLSSFVLFLCLGLFGHPLTMTVPWMFSDLLIFPLLDSLYGLLWFVIKIPRVHARAG